MIRRSRSFEAKRERKTKLMIGRFELVEADRPEGDQVSFIRPEFVECPTCAAKPGTPTLCPECLERRELHGFWKKCQRSS